MLKGEGIIDADASTQELPKKASSRSISWMIVWFSVVYWPVTTLLATRKQFWNDELFTYYISALGTFPRIWSGLLTAADQNPPLFYWLTHKATEITTQQLVGLRVPAMAGFWLMGICMIVFVSRHLPAAYGLTAAFIVLHSGAYWYAYEARPYGIVMGLCSAALLCWQRADGPHLHWWTIGLATTLGLAVSVHYYCILLFVPLVSAQAYRSLLKGRMEWPVWLAFVAGVGPLLLYVPLIRSARSYGATFWARAGLSSMKGFFDIIISPAIFVFVILIVWSVYTHLKGSRTFVRTSIHSIPVPVWELVAVIGLISIVPLAIVLGRFVTGAYTHRYALSAVIGLSILVVWMFAFAFQGRSRPALALAAVLTCYFVVREVRGLDELRALYDHGDIIRGLEEDTRGDLRIAVAGPHLFFEVFYQSPMSLRRRLFYVAEPKIALRRVTTDAVDRGLIDMRPFASLQLRTLAQVANSREDFLIVGYPAEYGWLVDELTSLHMQISVDRLIGERITLLAQPSLPRVRSDEASDGALR